MSKDTDANLMNDYKATRKLTLPFTVDWGRDFTRLDLPVMLSPMDADRICGAIKAWSFGQQRDSKGRFMKYEEKYKERISR